MKILNLGNSACLDDLYTARPNPRMNLNETSRIDGILDDIKKNGDNAVINYAKEFDGVELTADEFLVRADEIENAAANLGEEAKKAINVAYENIATFSRQHVPHNWTFSPRTGVRLGERYAPFSRVAAYIPGGKAPLVSTVIHTVTLAKVAGVQNIAMTTPVGTSGEVHPAILYAAKISGATEVYRLGGVYAIGALAFGTESIKKVEKIVGPGNAYVVAAKQKVYGQVALDLVAGPSEVLIIADGNANPTFIAADMLAQAEHGSGHEMVILITDSDEIISRVRQELVTQCSNLQRRKMIQTVLDEGTYLIKVSHLEAAIDIANQLAPEHLEILTADPRKVVEKITAAGAIFIGAWTPEAIGDYLAGPSHVLPTSGAARCFSGLTVYDFFRRMSTVEYNKEALVREAGIISEFSQMEKLDGHGHAAKIRFDESNFIKSS